MEWIGNEAAIGFCLAVFLFCKLGGVGWVRTVIATVVGAVTLRLAYELAFQYRLQQDMKLSPHDGQTGMDVMAFAIIVAAITSVCAVAVSIWVTRRGWFANVR